MFTIQYLNHLKTCKTSEQLNTEIDKLETFLNKLKIYRDKMELNEINDITLKMKKYNKVY